VLNGLRSTPHVRIHFTLQSSRVFECNVMPSIAGAREYGLAIENMVSAKSCRGYPCPLSANVRQFLSVRESNRFHLGRERFPVCCRRVCVEPRRAVWRHETLGFRVCIRRLCLPVGRHQVLDAGVPAMPGFVRIRRGYRTSQASRLRDPSRHCGRRWNDMHVMLVHVHAVLASPQGHDDCDREQPMHVPQRSGSSLVRAARSSSCEFLMSGVSSSSEASNRGPPGSARLQPVTAQYASLCNRQSPAVDDGKTVHGLSPARKSNIVSYSDPALGGGYVLYRIIA
jgi:hypothetical protein